MSVLLFFFGCYGSLFYRTLMTMSLILFTRICLRLFRLIDCRTTQCPVLYIWRRLRINRPVKQLRDEIIINKLNFAFITEIKEINNLKTKILHDKYILKYLALFMLLDHQEGCRPLLDIGLTFSWHILYYKWEIFSNHILRKPRFILQSFLLLVY